MIEKWEDPANVLILSPYRFRYILKSYPVECMVFVKYIFYVHSMSEALFVWGLND